MLFGTPLWTEGVFQLEFHGEFHGDTPLRHSLGRILPFRWQKTTLDVEGNSPKNRLVQKCCVPIKETPLKDAEVQMQILRLADANPLN